MDRRTFLASGAGLVLAGGIGAVRLVPKRVAAVNTVYFRMSHAYHIVGRLVNGYTVKSKHHRPGRDGSEDVYAAVSRHRVDEGHLAAIGEEGGNSAYGVDRRGLQAEGFAQPSIFRASDRRARTV